MSSAANHGPDATDVYFESIDEMPPVKLPEVGEEENGEKEFPTQQKQGMSMEEYLETHKDLLAPVSPFDEPKRYFRNRLEWRLEKPVRPDDCELFMGEKYVFYSPKPHAAEINSRRVHLEKRRESGRIREKLGIWTLFDLLGHLELEHGGGSKDDVECWTTVFGNLPSLVESLKSIDFEGGHVNAWVSRVVKIKRKLTRMPSLNDMSDEVDVLFCVDDYPGYLHKHDSTLLEALAYELNILVERSSDPPFYSLCPSWQLTGL